MSYPPRENGGGAAELDIQNPLINGDGEMDQVKEEEEEEIDEIR
jgi:hypothetical protein